MDTRKKRIQKVSLITGALLTTGLIYAYGAIHWGWWLPCIFNQITGLQCPGCGVSRMFLALFRLDFARAFYWNPLVIVLLPFLVYLYGFISWQYISSGDLCMPRWQQWACCIIIAALLIFGILRNL